MVGFTSHSTTAIASRSVVDEPAVAPFIAGCIAVALSYTSHPHGHPILSTPYGRLREIDDVR
jgi:hypothetical protein